MLDFIVNAYQHAVPAFWFTVAMWDSGASWTMFELVNATNPKD